MFVRNPSTGEVCLCGPAGAVNRGKDWSAVLDAYAAAGAKTPRSKAPVSKNFS